MVPAPLVLCECARVCRVRAVWCRCSARVWRTRSRVRTGWGGVSAADTAGDHRSPLSARCTRVCDGGLVLRVSVRPCRRRRGAGTSGAMRMRARLSGRSLVSLFCSRVANARAFAALGRGDGGVRMAMMGLGRRCRCLRVQFNESGEYCCVGVGFECKMPLTTGGQGHFGMLCSAVSYSPTPCRVQYHRRWRA